MISVNKPLVLLVLFGDFWWTIRKQWLLRLVAIKTPVTRKFKARLYEEDDKRLVAA